jgi:hypothetical protein
MLTWNSSTTARIEAKLEKFMAEMRHGLRERSVVSTATIESVETRESWQQLRRELEDVGLSKTVINENQQYITEWFKQALTAGLLNEAAIGEPGTERRPVTLAQISSRDSALGDSVIGGSTVAGDDASPPHTPKQLTHSLSISLSPPALNLANNPFFEAARERYASDMPSADLDLPTIIPYTTTSSSSSQPRKRSRKFSSLMFKLLKSPLAIIEAASDGDAAKVSKLISLGGDVNAVDKWKWTAMSMAAYGGHVEVAKILMAAGARLDMKDVDGEIPLDLALKSGHREMVMLIEEEGTRRDVEAIGEA